MDLDNPVFVIVVAIFVVVGVFVGSVFGLFVVVQTGALIFQPKVIAFVDGKEVFRGSNACLEESSLGAATHLQIGIGPLCLMPGPTYISKNVEAKPLQ